MISQGSQRCRRGEGRGKEPGDSWPQPPLPPQREREREREREQRGKGERGGCDSPAQWQESTQAPGLRKWGKKERESGGGAGRLFIDAVFPFCECVYASQMRGARWTVAGLCILFFSFTRTNVPFGTRCSGEKQAKRAPSKIQRCHLSPSPLSWAETQKHAEQKRKSDITAASIHVPLYLSSIHPSLPPSLHPSIVCLSVCLSIYLSSVCLSLSLHHLSVYLSSVCLSVYLSIYLSICLSVYLSIHPSSVCLSVCLSIYLSIYLSIVCLSLSLYLSIICLSVLSIYLSF